MEVKIGVQHAARDLVIETDESAESIEKLVAEAIGSDGVLALTDNRGRRVLVPAPGSPTSRSGSTPARWASGTDADRPGGPLGSVVVVFRPRRVKNGVVARTGRGPER